MIPVLYSETERDYGHGGIGVLTDTMTYLVTEEANGEFELYLEYPVQGAMFTELKNNRLIRAKPNDLDDDHVFRIYEVVKDLERQTVYIYATSITNDLGTNMVSSLTISSNTAQEALNMLKANLIEPTYFNFVSDISTRSSTEWEFRNPLNCIVGEDGSMVKYWGGEVKRTNDTVYLYARRGRDNVAVLREGKNLEGLEMTISTKGIVTKILPYMIRYDDTTGEENLIVGNIVTSPLVDNYPVKSIRAVDYTMYDDVDTVAELNALASGYFTYQNPGVDKPKVSIDIDIMQLADSPLYSQYSKLESLGLFDSVSVYIPRFDVSVIVKVNKIEYNGLLERAEKIQCGDPVGNIFDDIKAGYTNMIFDTEAKITNIVQRAANGVSTIFRGPSEPTIGVKLGDLWYKPIGEFEMELYQWNGMEWEPIITAGMSEAVRLEVDKAIEEIDEVRNTANEAVEMVEQNELAIFGKLDLSEYEANKTAVESELGKKLATATYNAQKQAQDALIAGKVATDTYNTKVTELNSLIDGKVATNTYNEKVTELNSLIDAVQSKADTAAEDLLKKADTSFVNTELDKKLATSTYNTKMASLDTAISGHNTRIKATEDGLVLTATKVEVDAVRTRMSEAETEISQNSDAIALKASQSSLDTTNGKLATAEASLVVQAGEIASKVSQTDFNDLNGRVSTAETTITQQAGKIALKASQLDLDAATDDISDVQASLTVQAGEIASKVSQTDFNALNGRVSTAETSITANTTAIGLRATKSDLDATKGRLTTAEGTITAQAGQIALKANTTTVSALTGRVSAAESSLSVQSGKIDLAATKTELNTAIDGIEVGGRNLLRGTTDEWIDVSAIAGTHQAMLSGFSLIPLEDVGFSGGEDFVAHIKVKDINEPIRFRFEFWNSASDRTSLHSQNLEPTNGIVQAEIKGVILSGYSHIRLQFSPNGHTRAFKYSYSELKLEKGNKATDWTPAPEDVDKAISTVQANLTVEADKIASKVSQTDFNALNGRVGTAESSISQQAGEIALRVTTATYNSGIGSKENTITKSNTAPTHLNGRLWLDTSKTPNILKRSTGSAWVKVTPTTAGEVGAYSASAGSTLAGRVSTAETSITANTTAINLRATKTDLDAAKGRLTTAEGTISVQAGQIALKANQTTVDTLTGRVGTAETNISANTTAINLRATKSSVDTLTGRVTTAEGSITTQAGQIALRATTATVNALTGRVSTAESTISANTSAINLRATKTELTTAIEGVEIGGRNLIVRSTITRGKFLKATGGESSNTAWFYTDFIPVSNYKNLVTSGYSNLGNGPAVVYYNSSKVFVKGIANAGVEKAKNITIDNGIAYIRFSGEIKDLPTIKLEKGSAATDWTPAPEDVGTAISTVQANLTVEAGKITALTTRVSGTETNISNVTQTVSGINTTISTLRTDVNGKATIVSLNAVKSTADGNKTTISNHSGRLTTVEQKADGLQSTVASKADQSQVTQLSNSLTSVVTDLNNLPIGGRNNFTQNTHMEQLTPNSMFIPRDPDTPNGFRVTGNSSANGGIRIPNVITSNGWWTVSFDIKGSQSAVVGITVDVCDLGETRVLTNNSNTYERKSVSVYVTNYTKDAYNFVDFGGIQHAYFWIDNIKVEKGNKATDWSPAPEDMATTSQITQLTSAINLRVTKGELMSQINVEAGRTLISSSKLYLDSDTVAFSGRAFIPSAAITEIDASKITTGTLNAANVNVINVSVHNLVGNMTSFIQSAWNTIGSQINIDGNAINAWDSAGNIASMNSSGEFRSQASGADKSRGIFYKGRIWFYAQSGSAVLNIGSHPVVGEGVHRGVLATARAEKLVIGRYNDYLNSNPNAQVNPYISLEYTGTIGDESNAQVKIHRHLSMNLQHIKDVQEVSGWDLAVRSTRGRLMLGVTSYNTLQVAAANTQSYGNIEMMQGYVVAASSDERLKNSITPTLISGLKVVNALEFYDYYWNDRPEIGKQFGLIAQRSPFVSEQNSGSGYWGINMNKLSLATAMAVKEVDTKVARIDTYVSQHELEIKTLKERIKQLEEQ